MEPDLRLLPFVRLWFREWLGVEGRFWRGLWSATLKPGDGAVEALEGGAVHSTPPVRLYWIVNFIFFLTITFLNSDNFQIWSFNADALSQMPPNNEQALAEKMNGWPGGEAVFRAVLDSRIDSNEAVFFCVLIPAMALPLWLVYFRRRRFLAEHLLYTTALATFFLITLLLFGLFGKVTRLTTDLFGLSSDVAGSVVLIAVQIWFLALLVGFARAARRFYGLGTGGTILAPFVHLVVFLPAVFVYAKLLFWVTLITMNPQAP